MTQTFNNASVTFSLIDPKDGEAKPITHRIDNLVETADEVALDTIGQAFQALYPDLELSEISTNIETLVTTATPVTADDATVDQQPAADESTTQPA